MLLVKNVLNIDSKTLKTVESVFFYVKSCK